ncbi:MAG: hypothetical protein C4560_09645 [Nitrospiraceae bacterium]|nr:MAG: hypothetical protein C4560_09645 [Nitrospiraceae bacterium]
MKKVLIISYFYPPRPGIGSQRPYRLSKYLPEFGWGPVVLTAKLPGKAPEAMRVIETGCGNFIGSLKAGLGLNTGKGLRAQMGLVSTGPNHSAWKNRANKIIDEVMHYPDDIKGWYGPAVRAAGELLGRERVDAIISTYYPSASHLIAGELKRKFNVPWIADFRDLWTQNHFYKKSGLIKMLERRLEMKTLARADAMVTVTESFADELGTLHSGKKIFCVTNGYDADEFPAIPAKLTDEFTITYTGQFYGGRRDPSPLFEAVARLLRENRINSELLRIRFCGPAEEWLDAKIKKYGLENVVRCYGVLPREEALERQRESQLLLLLLDRDNREEGVYPAKVFEYLGVRRPIIALGGTGGLVGDLLAKTRAGRFAGDADILKNMLLEYYGEFERSGAVACRSNGNVGDFSYRTVTRQYSDILNGVTGK